MDQPAHAEKPCLKTGLGPIEIIELSRTVLRAGHVIVNDSFSHSLLYVSWAASTAFRYVTPRGPKNEYGSVLKQTETTKQSLNYEPGCIKVVDTFRDVPA